jgi:hypothetical protein
MKKKKIIFAFMAAVILILLICIPLVTKINKNVKFQSKEEMSEVINGTWKTGDGEYDFVFTIDNNSAYMSNGDKVDDPSKIVLVPEKGYFYYEYKGDTKKSRYNVVYEDGEYLIKDKYWTFKK